MDNRIEQYKKIQEKALDIFTKKNTDYGDVFSIFGIIGLLVRIQDKIQRAINISKTKIVLVKDETLKDTLLDLHNYCALALLVMDENEKENENENIKKEN